LTQEPELGKRFNVKGFPAIFYISKGKVVDMEYGFLTKEELSNHIKNNF